MDRTDPRERLERDAAELDVRQHELDRRQTELDETPVTDRDRAALLRLADDTDVLADARDKHADDWDHLAEQRDLDGDERDVKAHARDLAARDAEAAGSAPADRGIERYWTVRDRDSATFDRHDAADDRRRAAFDRARAADLRRRARKDREEGDAASPVDD